MTNEQPDNERDYRLVEVQGYMKWSQSKLKSGESEALIAHLDATCMWLRPSQLNEVTNEDFEDMLEDLKAGLELDDED